MGKLRTAVKNAFITAVVENKHVERFFLYALARKGVLFFRQLDDHAVIYHPHDILGQVVTEEGVYSRHPIVNIAAEFAAKDISISGKWVLDIGANIGTQTIYFCRQFEDIRVLAVEPDPDNFAILKRNIALNGLEDRVVLVNAAVSDKVGSVDMQVDFYNRGATSVTSAPTGDQVFSVDCVTMDALLSEQGINFADIGLIWVDVEGHEIEVFSGMMDALKAHKPPLFFEYTALSAEKNAAMEDFIFDTYTNVFTSKRHFTPLDREGFRKITGQSDIWVPE